MTYNQFIYHPDQYPTFEILTQVKYLIHYSILRSWNHKCNMSESQIYVLLLIELSPSNTNQVSLSILLHHAFPYHKNVMYQQDKKICK